MNKYDETHDLLARAWQEWNNAKTHLSKAIQAYVSATTMLESIYTSSEIRARSGAVDKIENSLDLMERDELDLKGAHATLKRTRNSCVPPVNALPFEILALVFKTAVSSAYFSTSFQSARNLSCERKFSQVCSRWRQVALDVCPIWPQLRLLLNNDGGYEDNLSTVIIGFVDTRGVQTTVPLFRQPDVGDTQYIQTAFATITPYMKQLGYLQLAANNIEQLQPFLDFWLERGTPGSLDGLILSLRRASLLFPATCPHSNDRLCQFLRHVKNLKLSSVGLNWSSLAFDRLTTMDLDNLPSFCCPNLEQFAQVLSTCPGLETLRLQRIAIPNSRDSSPPEPVELDHLNNLFLKDVDVPRVLSIVSSRCKLDLHLQGTIDDVETLESLRSFASRVNMSKLFLTLSETRSDTVLARLLYFAIASIPTLRRIQFLDMNLRDSELSGLATHLSTPNNPPPSPDVATGRSPSVKGKKIQLQCCSIPITAEAFHNAVSALPWPKLTLTKCDFVLAPQGEAGGAAEIRQRITTSSGYGIRLKELMPNRLDIC